MTISGRAYPAAPKDNTCLLSPDLTAEGCFCPHLAITDEGVGSRGMHMHLFHQCWTYGFVFQVDHSQKRWIQGGYSNCLWSPKHSKLDVEIVNCLGVQNSICSVMYGIISHLSDIKVMGCWNGCGQRSKWHNSQWLCVLGYSRKTWKISWEVWHIHAPWNSKEWLCRYGQSEFLVKFRFQKQLGGTNCNAEGQFVTFWRSRERVFQKAPLTFWEKVCFH